MPADQTDVPSPRPAASRRRRRRRAAGVVLVGTAAATVAGFSLAGGPSGPSGQAQPSAIQVGDQACASAWRGTISGRHVYQVTDTGPSPEEVSIVGPDHLTTYAEVEMVAPRTTVDLVAVLPPGRYSWFCEADDGTESYSDQRQVTGGPVAGATSWIPVDYDELSGAVETYRASVSTGLTVLAAATDRLTAAVDAGSLQQAEQLWLPAHLDYERLGAAYDTFGKFADEINGRADGLAGGVRSPQFTGFLRLEYGLWHHQGQAVLTRVANTLDKDVHGLVAAFPEQQTDPNDIALRTHEILENTLEFELTGDTDEGSNTNLATASANIQGTEMTLDSLRPLLKLTDPSLLRRLTAGLGSLGSLVDSYRHPDGTWTALQALTRSQREHLDGAVGNMLEELSPLPDHLDLLLTHDNTN